MYRHIKVLPILIACGLLCMGLGAAIAEEGEVVGIIGLSPVENSSCIGVWVPLATDEALMGVRWYNNDGTVTFPKICVSGGDTEGPGILGDAVIGREVVLGGSSMWSQVIFNETYGSDSGGLYVLFQLPYGSVHVAEGEGGGAGVGYMSDGTGLSGWMTLDGEEWFPLHADYGFAVEAFTDTRDQWAVILEQASKSFRTPGDGLSHDSVELRTVLLPAQPNPFNPQTDLRFTLKEAGRVDLGIYDLHGRLVCQLANRVYSAGDHVLTWCGHNDRGREVASGVYLARLIVGRYSQTHRLVLVR